jgi:hypothetical protein
MPATQFVSELAESRLEKRPDLALSWQNPLCPIRQCDQDRRRFKYGILCIERYQAIQVALYDRFLPLAAPRALVRRSRQQQKRWSTGGCETEPRITAG